MEALYRRRGAVGHVEGAGDVEPPGLERFQETLEEVLGQPDVGVEEDQDVPGRAPATHVPPARYGRCSSQHLYGREPSRYRHGSVCGTRVDDQHLVLYPSL